MELIDIGVNLTNPVLYKQLGDIVQNAKSVGVVHQIITGTSVKSSEQAHQITQTDPEYFSSTAGCHPHDAKDFKSDDIKLLLELAEEDTVVAVGECGLDFNRNYSPQDIQLDVFKSQIEIACQVNLPLFMHQRDAHKQFIEILSHYKQQFKSGVIHCFTGDRKQLRDCLDLGLYIGITGWLCDERRGSILQEAIKYMPLDRIMIETDAPYLMPRNITPKQKSNINTPSNLPWIVNQISLILGVEDNFIAEVTTNNATNFFELST